MRLLTVALVLLWPISCLPQTTPEATRGFAIIETQEGWPIPAHGAPFATTTKPYGKSDQVVTVLRFRTSDSFALPRHYQSTSGALELLSLYFYTDEIDALEYKGARFAYTAIVKGKQVGIVSRVSWVDVDGSGVFTRIVWGAGEPDIPQWAIEGKRH